MSTDDVDLTRPERYTARGQGRSVREQVKADGGCAYCTRRLTDMFSGVGRRALCGVQPRKFFPACITQPGGFDFDQDAYDRMNGGEK